MNNYTCRICNNDLNNTPYSVKEMMLALREEFEYFQCSRCGCLQIKEFPANIGKYYPDDYYSYMEIKRDVKITLKDIFLKIYFQIRLRVNKHIGNYLPGYNSVHSWLKKDFVSFDSNILDVGCGSGKLLMSMKNLGFKKLTGIDPFIPETIHYDRGITIHKNYLHQIEDQNEKFDFIMLHHSFEHMENPLSTLKSIYKLLNNNCYALIRIPVADSYAWRKYGVNWVQLDAPRHFFLHTTQSIQTMSEQCGFKLKKILFDSCDFQFMGSEMYCRNTSLYENVDFFDKKDISYFRKESQRLNNLQDGDSACFYLLKE